MLTKAIIPPYLRADDHLLSRFSPTMLTPGTLRNTHPKMSIPVNKTLLNIHIHVLSKHFRPIKFFIQITFLALKLCCMQHLCLGPENKFISTYICINSTGYMYKQIIFKIGLTCVCFFLQILVRNPKTAHSVNSPMEVICIRCVL